MHSLPPGRGSHLPEELLRQDPDKPDLLYNLGLCYVDLGRLDHGIAYQKSDLAQAKAFNSQALAADPKNPVALKNLGAILGREGDSLRALYSLRQSYQANPQGPADGVRLGLRLHGDGDIEQAQEHFQELLDMPAPEELRALARNGLWKIAMSGPE